MGLSKKADALKFFAAYPMESFSTTDKRDEATRNELQDNKKLTAEFKKTVKEAKSVYK